VSVSVVVNKAEDLKEHRAPAPTFAGNLQSQNSWRRV